MILSDVRLLAGLYLALVNALAFTIYGLDKRRARTGGRRISERALLAWALAGGSPGAWVGMRTFRHKTRKTSFRLRFWGVVLLQLALAIALGLLAISHARPDGRDVSSRAAAAALAPPVA